MKSLFIKILLGAVLLLVAYNSIYIKRLSSMASTNTDFNADQYAKNIWTQGLPKQIKNAISFTDFKNQVQQNKEQAFLKNTNALAIGNYRYLILHCKLTVTDVAADEIHAVINDGNTTYNTVIATEFIYGNAVRDASKLIDIKDFPNTNHLNAVSEALNKLVKSEVIKPLKEVAKKGATMELSAALEINKEQVNWNTLELIPLEFKPLELKKN